MAELRVTVYGGAAGEIGGNRILLETGEGNWLLDFGTRFGETGKYFEEFVKPRGAALGLRDFLRMGLLPPLEGLYRDDLWCHEPDCWERYRSHPHYAKLGEVRGVLLSHAHMDHNGCLGFLKPEIPVYTGLTTAIIGKCLQDPRPTGPDVELCYLAPKQHAGDGVLGGVRGAPREQRKHYICEGGPEIERTMEALRPFWGSVPGERTAIRSAPLELAEPERFGVKFWRVDHSIPGSGAFAIRTPIGWVVYSGDLRLHGHSKWRTEAFARAAAALEPALLIVEGTRVGDAVSPSEPNVHQAVDETVTRAEGLVIADFSARNIERLRTFRDVAKARGRRLVITTKDAYLLARLHVIDPNIPSPDTEGLAILREPQATVQSWEREIHNEFAANFADARAIRRDPGAYILCLSYWDICNLVDLEPDGGTYIYSSSEAHSEEQRIDQERLLAWLRYFRLRVVGGLPGAEKGPYHASGHIDGPSLEQLIEEIAPKRLLPVHTEALAWFEQRWPAKVIRAEYARAVEVG
jgi:ribonuclease J